MSILRRKLSWLGSFNHVNLIHLWDASRCFKTLMNGLNKSSRSISDSPRSTFWPQSIFPHWWVRYRIDFWFIEITHASCAFTPAVIDTSVISHWDFGRKGHIILTRLIIVQCDSFIVWVDVGILLCFTTTDRASGVLAFFVRAWSTLWLVGWSW